MALTGAWAWPDCGTAGPMRKFAFCRALPMDIERINAIGTTLADLTARTDALRGYL
jgi:hypothetical protein